MRVVELCSVMRIAYFGVLSKAIEFSLQTLQQRPQHVGNILRYLRAVGCVPHITAATPDDNARRTARPRERKFSRQIDLAAHQRTVPEASRRSFRAVLCVEHLIPHNSCISIPKSRNSGAMFHIRSHFRLKTQELWGNTGQVKGIIGRSAVLTRDTSARVIGIRSASVELASPGYLELQK